jgi:hypothetical protein
MIPSALGDVRGGLNYLEQQLTQPMKARRKRRGWLLLVGVALSIVIIASIVGISLSFLPQRAATPQAQATSAPTQPQPTSASTQAGPIAASTQAITHGVPHLGGPISDFFGKYGPSDDQITGNSATWITDQREKTHVHTLANASGKITSVIVTSGAPWSDAQTKQYCSQFLPSGAQQFKAASDLTFYHSNAGEIVMQLTLASCTMMLAPQ